MLNNDLYLPFCLFVLCALFPLNHIIEALNGWMKEESYMDFDLAHCDDVPKLLDKYVRYFNE